MHPLMGENREAVGDIQHHARYKKLTVRNLSAGMNIRGSLFKSCQYHNDSMREAAIQISPYSRSDIYCRKVLHGIFIQLG